MFRIVLAVLICLVGTLAVFYLGWRSFDHLHPFAASNASHVPAPHPLSSPDHDFTTLRGAVGAAAGFVILLLILPLFGPFTISENNPYSGLYILGIMLGWLGTSIFASELLVVGARLRWHLQGTDLTRLATAEFEVESLLADETTCEEQFTLLIRNLCDDPRRGYSGIELRANFEKLRETRQLRIVELQATITDLRDQLGYRGPLVVATAS